jgi:hypothetical protein
MIELTPVPFPEPVERVLCGTLELGEGGEVAVDDAMPDLKERVGELEGLARWEP